MFVLAVLALSLASPAHAQNYIGAEACGTCHPWEYKKWLQGPHSKAHIDLSQEQRADARCMNCHTTLPDAPPRMADKLLGVQCERCHGPGRYYHARPVMKDKELARAVGLLDPKPEHCMTCHDATAPSVEPFDYATMWAVIDHGRKAREAAQAAATTATAAP